MEMLRNVSTGNLQLPGAIGNDDIVDLWLVAEFLDETVFCLGNEIFIQFFLDQIDGAAAETATHDT